MLRRMLQRRVRARSASRAHTEGTWGYCIPGWRESTPVRFWFSED